MILLLVSVYNLYILLVLFILLDFFFCVFLFFSVFLRWLVFCFVFLPSGQLLLFVDQYYRSLYFVFFFLQLSFIFFGSRFILLIWIEFFNCEVAALERFE